MGKSITCTYEVQISLQNTDSQYIMGAMSLKDIYKTALKVADDFRTDLKHVVIWGQTQTGKRAIKGDFAVMDAGGNITHHTISEDYFSALN